MNANRHPACPALTRTERATTWLADRWHASPAGRRASLFWSTRVIRRVVDAIAADRLVVHGAERLSKLATDRGVLFAPNHRSFFDLFVVMTAAYPHVRDCSRLYFPVRSSFWYDRWLGVCLNLFATGLAMYPPIFRLPEKRNRTRAGLDRLASELRRPGTLAGMHPEGTRAKTADVYTLLPPERSFGRVVLLGRPNLVPVFVSGLGNSLIHEMRAALAGRRAPIHVVFGEPVHVGDELYADPERLRSQIEVGRRALSAIEALAVTERELTSSAREGDSVGRASGQEGAQLVHPQ